MPPEGYYERKRAQDARIALALGFKIVQEGGSYRVTHYKPQPTPMELEAAAVNSMAADLKVGFSKN